MLGSVVTSARSSNSVNLNLRTLAEAGTSPWLDLLRRSLMTDGELARLVAEDKPLDVASVASFFVSRVDTAVDKRLEASGHEELCGKPAIANARLVYRTIERIFSGPRSEALRHAGAHVQRPLWASTGVKNPRYPDTMFEDAMTRLLAGIDERRRAIASPSDGSPRTA
jgi:hypothetical protein